MSKLNIATKYQKEPRQARAKLTYERLLGAAQDILDESGYEALNSNSIVERVGMTPPAFYRHFANKHALLYVLGQRLMEAQNQVLMRESEKPITTLQEVIEETRQTLELTIDVTRKFKGGRVLLTLIRSLPELQSIRTQSHADMAAYTSEALPFLHNTGKPSQVVSRARLALELGYTAIEMLFEVGFEDRKDLIERTARAVATVYFDD